MGSIKVESVESLEEEKVDETTKSSTVMGTNTPWKPPPVPSSTPSWSTPMVSFQKRSHADTFSEHSFPSSRFHEDDDFLLSSSSSIKTPHRAPSRFAPDYVSSTSSTTSSWTFSDGKMKPTTKRAPTQPTFSTMAPVTSAAAATPDPKTPEPMQSPPLYFVRMREELQSLQDKLERQDGKIEGLEKENDRLRKQQKPHTTDPRSNNRDEPGIDRRAGSSSILWNDLDAMYGLNEHDIKPTALTTTAGYSPGARFVAEYTNLIELDAGHHSLLASIMDRYSSITRRCITTTTAATRYHNTGTTTSIHYTSPDKNDRFAPTSI